MTRIALGLEYDGRSFHGWQRQKGVSSVQMALEEALFQIAGHPVHVVCAGRTDAGVHASGQVVHFDTSADRPETAWVRGVNRFLPMAVSVHWSREVPEDFHARYAAKSRRYRYLLLNRGARSGLWAGRAGWFHRPLCLEAMRRAAEFLVGEHDFSAFRAAECQAKNPVRNLTCAEIRQEGDFFFFDFEANAFLQHMVRNMVGSLVYAGKGAWMPEYLHELLMSRDRTLAAPTFPPDGLYFLGPSYDPALRLPTTESGQGGMPRTRFLM
ncbi:MAG: tRNA pseudouridine(38-40) synthase TruA [Zoogloeaceae bacterium]|jgi:tRNA pseudouridine38-40 synthase|nr:tRNA pseudouridine(38-40) synthase TruA [Zoogloeaceae bacterium]